MSKQRGTEDNKAWAVCVALVFLIGAMVMDNDKIIRADTGKSIKQTTQENNIIPLPKRKPMRAGQSEIVLLEEALHDMNAIKAVSGYPLPIPALENHK